MPHVLVVDDDPLIRTTIEACLERHNFRVTGADRYLHAAHARLRIDPDIP
jgi:DNA-binding response OmpR family regulator